VLKVNKAIIFSTWLPN